MKARPWGSLGAAARNSPARAQHGPLGTAPNPCLLWQEQIKGPWDVGRRGQTPAAADQSPRQPFVPGEEANLNSGTQGLSKAPPSSSTRRPRNGIPTSPINQRLEKEPSATVGLSLSLFLLPIPVSSPRGVTAAGGDRGGTAGEGTHGAASPPRRSSAGTPGRPKNHSDGAADGHNHGEGATPAPSAGRESQTSQGKFLPGVWPRALFHQGGL